MRLLKKADFHAGAVSAQHAPAADEREALSDRGDAGRL